MGYSNSPLVIFQLYYSNQKIIMLSKFVTILAMASTISASPLSKVAENTKAASPYVNIGCQCSPLTFLDQYGTTQGNCLSADSTGARWCYVDSAHTSSCQDLRFSARFPNNPWSYEACATPPPPVYAAPQAPLASFTAPHPHPHPAPVPSYPVQSGAFTSGGYHGGFNGNFGVANTGTLQPYGQYLPKSANRASGSSSDSVKF